MPATESLTIEILGDSSGLSQALDDALSRVESLQSAAETASTSAGGIGGRLASVSTSLQPLQLVGQQLTRISQLAQALGQQPITLNVQPALSALQSLMAAVQAVAAQISAISLPGPGPVTGPGGSGGPAPSGSLRTSLSAGSYVAPSLVVFPRVEAAPLAAVSETRASVSSHAFQVNDAKSMAIPQIPWDKPVQTSRPHMVSDATQLVIRELVASDPHSSGFISTPDARRANSSPTAFHSSTSSLDRSIQHDQSSSTVNHFGGITIEVRETADVNSLMRDLRLHGLSTRHRQG